MTTLRVSKREKFTLIDRKTANDARLSFTARGVLLWLLDKPDDRETTAEKIEQQGKEGREAVRSALKELEEFGYLNRVQWRDENQRYQTEWTISEEGNAGSPYTAFRGGKAAAGKPSSLIETDTDTKTKDQNLVRFQPQPEGCGECDNGRVFLDDNTVTNCECGVYAL